MIKLIKTLSIIWGFIISMSSIALTPTPHTDQKPVTQVFINAHIHVGNGQVLKNAQFAIEGGVIKRAGYYKMPFTGNEIDLKGQHIYPGFILTNTDLGLVEIGAVRASNDNREAGQLNPNVRSIVAYNTDSERIPTMRFNGILLAQPTPRGGLVSGISSIVQLDAWNWEDAAIKVDDGMHINWPTQWSNRLDRSTMTVNLVEDKKYPQKVNEIKQLFIDAKVDVSNTNLKLNAVKTILAEKANLYIHTNNPKSIIESITFFDSIGIKNLVLVTGQAAGQTIDFIKNSGVNVILNTTHALPQQADSSVDSVYTLPARLLDAGILTALSYAGSMSGRNLAFSAGTTAAYGNDANEALSLITLNAAKILGIDDQYGTLEIGKSATFFISEGDALDMRGNVVREAYIDGRPIELHTRQQQLYERYKKKYNQ